MCLLPEILLQESGEIPLCLCQCRTKCRLLTVRGRRSVWDHLSPRSRFLSRTLHRATPETSLLKTRDRTRRRGFLSATSPVPQHLSPLTRGGSLLCALQRRGRGVRQSGAGAAAEQCTQLITSCPLGSRVNPRAWLRALPRISTLGVQLPRVSPSEEAFLRRGLLQCVLPCALWTIASPLFSTRVSRKMRLWRP